MDAQEAHPRGLRVFGGQGRRETCQVPGRSAAWLEKESSPHAPIVCLGLEHVIFPSVLYLFGTGPQNKGKADCELAKGKVGPLGVAAVTAGETPAGLTPRLPLLRTQSGSGKCVLSQPPRALESGFGSQVKSTLTRIES